MRYNKKCEEASREYSRRCTGLPMPLPGNLRWVAIAAATREFTRVAIAWSAAVGWPARRPNEIARAPPKRADNDTFVCLRIPTSFQSAIAPLHALVMHGEHRTSSYKMKIFRVCDSRTVG